MDTTIRSNLVRGFCALFIACGTYVPLFGQTSDPFANPQANGSGDPFAAQKNAGTLPGTPITIHFQVSDHSGAPVSGARIAGIGMGNRIVTGKDGKAMWRTTQQRIAAAAKTQRGQLRFTAFPPAAAIMPQVTGSFPVADVLKESTPLTFRTTPGVRLRGRVIGQQDRKPIENIHLDFCSQTAPDGTRTDFRVETVERGEWSLVVPRVDSRVIATGHLPGYDIGEYHSSGKRYSKTVEVPADSEQVDVSDFEITQFAPRRIVVVDDQGRPLANGRAVWLRHPICLAPANTFAAFSSHVYSRNLLCLRFVFTF